METKHFRPSEEYRRTTNRPLFNKLHKHLLEKSGKIRCSWCGYHRGENGERKYYGEIRSFSRDKESTFRYPSWKLATKKEKQWMEGTYRKVHRLYTRRWDMIHEYVEFKI